MDTITMSTQSKPKVTVRDFIFQRVRTITGSGVRLFFGSYTFVLVNKDGTPERTLDTDGVERVMLSIYKVPKEKPIIAPSGKSGPVEGHC